MPRLQESASGVPASNELVTVVHAVPVVADKIPNLEGNAIQGYSALIAVSVVRLPINSFYNA